MLETAKTGNTTVTLYPLFLQFNSYIVLNILNLCNYTIYLTHTIFPYCFFDNKKRTPNTIKLDVPSIIPTFIFNRHKNPKYFLIQDA